MIVGVTTTGVYCRPSCSGRPKPESIRLFGSTAAARAAGLRACKRCRPDGEVEREGGAGLALRLTYRRPLDAAGLIGFLAARAVAGVEEATEDGGYRRSLRLPRGAGLVELTPAKEHIRATFWLDDMRDLDAAVARCRTLLDLDADPAPVVEALGEDPLLGPVVRSAPGRRVPGHVDGGELAVRAVLGQQVSVQAAATHAARLVANLGEPLKSPRGAVTHLFPSMPALAASDPNQLAMPNARRRALLTLAQALSAGDLVLDAGADREEARRRLVAVPGIGHWTAAYVSMRALRDPDAFLPTDLGVRRGLERLGADGRPANAARLAERWRPYRSSAVIHLWAA
jgi:AraC family transcriptional regulator, regulatory protein of adaptative response / DNA-3-methyladenine glycosylase II